MQNYYYKLISSRKNITMTEAIQKKYNLRKMLKEVV